MMDVVKELQAMRQEKLRMEASVQMLQQRLAEENRRYSILLGKIEILEKLVTNDKSETK